MEDDKLQSEKLTSSENELLVGKIIQKLLLENGIHNFEPEVVSHISDYIDVYLTELLGNAKVFMNHAGRTELNAADIQLAAKNYSEKNKNNAIDHKELVAKAQELNARKLPEIADHYGLRLPPIDTTTKCNYKLKDLNTQHVNYIDYTVSDPSVGTMKNPFGISTIIRTPKKGPFLANVTNQNTQRIAIKPKLNLGFNVNAIQDKKTFKFN